MKCMACGAEMILIKAVPDHSTMVAGFERHTLQCSGCGEVEGRLIFSRERARPAESAAVHAAPPISPATTVQASPAAPGLLRRVAAMLRGRPGQ